MNKHYQKRYLLNGRLEIQLGKVKRNKCYDRFGSFVCNSMTRTCINYGRTAIIQLCYGNN